MVHLGQACCPTLRANKCIRGASAERVLNFTVAGLPRRLHTCSLRSPAVHSMSNLVTATAKKELRSALKAELKTLTLETQRAESEVIQGLTMAASFFKESSRVGLYVHCEKLREVATDSLLKALLSDPSKRCYVPLIKDSNALMYMLHIENSATDLQPMTMGILEPTVGYPSGKPREEGLGFDRRCNRLGRGGGYYDCYIEKLYKQAADNGSKPPLLVALAFSKQLCDSIPMAPNDMPVDYLVTVDGIFKRPEVCSK